MHIEGYIAAVGVIGIARTVYGENRSAARGQKLLVQLVHQAGSCTLTTKQGVEIAPDVGLVREAKQVQEICIDFHVLDVVEALREKEDVQLVMVAVHGEELEETLPLSAMLQTHDANVVDDDVRMRSNVHLLDGLGHDAVVLEVLHAVAPVLLRRGVGNDHHSLRLDHVHQSLEKVRLSHVALSEKQHVLAPLSQRR